jgi:hypothetical protein
LEGINPSRLGVLCVPERGVEGVGALLKADSEQGTTRPRHFRLLFPEFRPSSFTSETPRSHISITTTITEYRNHG